MLTVQAGALPRPVSSCMTLNPLAALALSPLWAPHTLHPSFSRCWPSDTSRSLLKCHPLSRSLPELLYDIWATCLSPHSPPLHLFCFMFLQGPDPHLTRDTATCCFAIACPPPHPPPPTKISAPYRGTLTPLFMASYPILRKVPGTGEGLK